MQFSAAVWAGNNPLVLESGFAWTPVANPVATGPEATVTVSASTQAVVVAVGGATCSAKVVPLALLASGVRVSVTDERTGRPVPGTKVVLSDSTGTTLDTLVVDAVSGTAVFGAVTGKVTLSAFNAGYDYLTVADYDLGAANAKRDISLVIRRNRLDAYGGYKGTFGNVPVSPHLKLGYAATSLSNTMTDAFLDDLFGAPEPVDVKIGTLIDQKDVPVPAGVFMGYDVNAIKPIISARGPSGVCVDSVGNPDEMQILAGTCGADAAWALAWDVPLSDFSAAAATLTGVQSLSDVFGLYSPLLVPSHRRLKSSVVRDVQFSLRATPTINGQPDFSDTSQFTTLNHDFTQVPLAFSFALKVADLPKLRGGYVDEARLLGGVLVPGRGFVPLGLGLGENRSPADAKVDKQPALPSSGLVGLRMAPAHHGLEGGTYGVVVLGAPRKGVTPPIVGTGGSAVFARIPSNKLLFDSNGLFPIDLSGEAFPAIQEHAKYNFVSSAYQGMAGRTFRFTQPPDVAGVSVVRVSFSSSDGKRWSVLADPAALASGSFTLPLVPSGLQDRTFSNGSQVTGQRSDMRVQTFRLATVSGATVGFDSLVENNATNADRLLELTRAYTSMEYRRPAVEWVSPAFGGTTVVGGVLRVAVSHFEVGTDPATADGLVRISCGGGASQAVELSAYSDPAKGEVSGVLPSGCGPGVVTLTATLLDTTGVAIQPAASFLTTVTIQ